MFLSIKIDMFIHPHSSTLASTLQTWNLSDVRFGSVRLKIKNGTHKRIIGSGRGLITCHGMLLHAIFLSVEGRVAISHPTDMFKCLLELRKSKVGKSAGGPMKFNSILFYFYVPFFHNSEFSLLFMNTKWILDDILYAFALVKGPQAEKMMKLIIEKMKKNMYV